MIEWSQTDDGGYNASVGAFELMLEPFDGHEWRGTVKYANEIVGTGVRAKQSIEEAKEMCEWIYKESLKHWGTQ